MNDLSVKSIKPIKPSGENRPWTRCSIRAGLSTVSLSARQVFDGGILCVAGEYLVRFIQFVMLILVWKSLAGHGVSLNGMTMAQLLTYTLMSSVFHQQLDIISPATSSLWEGSIIGRYLRPFPVIGSFVAETIGRWWIPVFLFYGLPLWCLAPLLGVSPLPSSLQHGCLAGISLVLSASLGFAIDLLFAALAIRLKNGCWAVTHIRESIYSLLSGELIPFALFPWGLGNLFSLTPFGSIAHAPLTIYVGLSPSPLKTLGIQLAWNVVLWRLAILVFHKSEERMISYGG